MVAGSSCRRLSTLVERSVESPDTFLRDRTLTTQSSSIFNQLPRSGLERVFGRRSALFPGVERKQGLKASEKCLSALDFDGRHGARETEPPDVCCYK